MAIASTTPTRSTGTTAGNGLTAAIAAFVIWGFFPIYLLGLTSVSAMQITAHRIAWSCVFVLAWLVATGEMPKLRAAMTRPGVLIRLAASAFFIAANWLAFAWAVNHDRVLDVSLGYYIGPLLNVLLGIVVLSERLDRTQWTAVGFATAGVLYLSIIAGHAPWVALTVAISFSLYGLIRKTVSIDALPGLAVETVLLMPFAAGYLIWCEAQGTGVLGHSNPSITVLLLLSGVITSVPLFLFAYGARRIPFSTMGVIQFIGPSLQFVCGLLVFREPFGSARAFGFILIWIALLIYAVHGLRRAAAPPQPA
ncbi:MAG: EamA family transporter RarD [Pseudomonadota bacterium]